MSNQGTIRLKVTNGAPAIEKLWNGRFKLEFFCDNNSPREDWYYENVSALLPEYGILQTTNFGSGVSEDWEAIPDSVYPDMRLVLSEYPYNVRAGKHYVKLTYETLTAAWVEEKAEDTDYELNGLKRVSRTFVALPATTYDKVVGTSTIDSDGTTLYLGNFKIEKTDAKWELTEVWLEAGTLSETLDNVGSQKAKVIETIGDDPATPTGYSLASKRESDFEGFQTNRFTFLKPSILSLQQDFNNGLKQVSVQAFGMTATEVSAELAAITTHELISQTESDYEGIKTSTFQYQLDESFTEEYEADGFKRIILKELSTSSIAVAAIGSPAPASGPASGLFLASQKIDNGGVIKVRETVWIEAGVISITPMEEDGFSLAASYVYVTTNAPASSMTGLTTPSGLALPSTLTWYEPSIQNVEGYPTYTQKVILKTVASGGVLVHSTDKFFTITEPGVMSTGGAFNSNTKSGAATRYPEATQQPRTYRKKATVDVYLTSSNSITESEVAFTEKGVDWCSIGFDSFYTNDTESTASVSSSWRSFPQYLNSSGTTDTANASILGVYYAVANSYGAGDTTYTTSGIYRVDLAKYTRAVDGTQLYLKTIVTF